MFSAVVNWFERHMFPCAYKSIFGIDCPGCGFQRACIALMRGNLVQSFKLYPAAIPVIITGVFLLMDVRYKFEKTPVIKKGLFAFTGSVIVIAYLDKMIWLYAIH